MSDEHYVMMSALAALLSGQVVIMAALAQQVPDDMRDTLAQIMDNHAELLKVIGENMDEMEE